MIIVHTPSDGDEVEQFDFKTIRTAEASRITTLLTDKAAWPEVKRRLADDDPDVMRVVGFVLKCRTQPDLRLADFDPMVADLAVRFDHSEVDEWAAGAANLVAVYEGTVEQLEIELSVILDLAADTDYARTVIERVIAGKFPPAPSNPSTHEPIPTTEGSTSSEPGTSDSSPTSSTSTEPASAT